MHALYRIRSVTVSPTRIKIRASSFGRSTGRGIRRCGPFVTIPTVLVIYGAHSTRSRSPIRHQHHLVPILRSRYDLAPERARGRAWEIAGDSGIRGAAV